jgi:putative aminopeptidase FrvX
MDLDLSKLCEWCTLPSVGTACSRAASFLRTELSNWNLAEITDGGLLATAPGGTDTDVRLLLVTHVDEIGGIVGQEVSPGLHACKHWGAPPSVFRGGLQAFWYDSNSVREALCEGIEDTSGDEHRLLVRGSGLTPWHTFFTFNSKARVKDDDLYSKAIDPRATAWAALLAAKELNDPQIGLLFCYAEECSMTAAQKAAWIAAKRFPNLQYVVNADVPAPSNIEGAGVGDVALRYLEGTRHIDPVFTLRTYEALKRQGSSVKLAAARTGSQTAYFVPYAQCLSVALPADNIHTSCARMPVKALGDCVEVLVSIARLLLSDAAFPK